ncbi:unnamed protein product [Symbiodinium necroappetens]|uniref:Uncharacterized protein n=1 Tax=Symbiodinium necroappetens TaxID=1628268 RepID=A0A813AVP2_9DINO|nr:unnamed protein product [Symbiodinium necroappetens]
MERREGLRLHHSPRSGGRGGSEEHLRTPVECGGQHQQESHQPPGGLQGPLQVGGARWKAQGARRCHAREGRQAPPCACGRTEPRGEKKELFRHGRDAGRAGSCGKLAWQADRVARPIRPG